MQKQTLLMTELRSRASLRQRTLKPKAQKEKGSTRKEDEIDTSALLGLRKRDRELALHSMAMCEDSDDEQAKHDDDMADSAISEASCEAKS